MKISDLIKMGLRNLGRRKARTALTVIGVVIGSISIITMVSIGIGMNTNYQKQVMEMGSLNTITISQYQDVMDDKGQPVDFKEQKIDDNLLKKILELDYVKAASPNYYVNGGQIIANNRYNSMYSVNVVDFASLETFGAPALSYGSYPTEEELNGNEYFVLLGKNVAENGFYDPNSRVWKEISFDPKKDKLTFTLSDYEFADPNTGVTPTTRPFKMTVGIFEGTDNYEYDYSIYIDSRQYEKMCHEYMKELSAANKKKLEKKISEFQSIKVCVDNVKNVDSVRDKIKEMGYYSSNVGDYTKSAEQTSKMLQMVLGAVGAVAMLVSAISIANTMIMSIYERTKEIGVMKVLGCLVGDIKKLFLFESAMIGLIGGGIGIAISYILSYCINKFGGPMFEALMSSGSLNGQTETVSQFSIIPVWLPFGAALFAMLIGILSGYYPAKRATKISAIEAMKTEG